MALELPSSVADPEVYFGRVSPSHHDHPYPDLPLRRRPGGSAIASCSVAVDGGGRCEEASGAASGVTSDGGNEELS